MQDNFFENLNKELSKANHDLTKAVEYNTVEKFIKADIDLPDSPTYDHPNFGDDDPGASIHLRLNDEVRSPHMVELQLDRGSYVGK